MQNIKKIAFSAATGLLLLVPSLAAAQSSSAGFTEQAKQTGDQAWEQQGAKNVQSSGLPTGSIYNIIAATMKWLLAILGFIAIIGFVIAGILYLTAAGDESQIEKAKTAMTYSIIGVIVALLGYVIVQAVSLWLGSSSTF